MQRLARPAAVLLLAATAAAAVGGALTFDSYLAFPTPHDKVTGSGFSDAYGYGVRPFGVLFGTTAVTGNADAPINGGCAILINASSPCILGFNPPRQYVGVSAGDADYTVDAPAVITITAFGAGGSVIGTHSRVLAPANSLAEQNGGAVFLGIATDTPFRRVEISTSLSQTTILDNLVFEPQ